MFKTTALDNKPNFLYVQGALAQKSNNDLAGLVLQNFDNDTKITYTMASIVLQDHDGNSQHNGRGDLIFKTSPGESVLNEVLRVTHGGRVGIQTSNPEYDVHIRGSVFAETYCNLPLSNLQSQITSLSNSTVSLSNQFTGLSNASSNLIFRPSFTYFVDPNSAAFTTASPVNFVRVDSNLTTSPIVNQSGFRAPATGKYFFSTNLRVIAPAVQSTTPVNIHLVKSFSSNPGNVTTSDLRVVATLGAPIIGTSGLANAATYSGDSTFTLTKLLYMESNSYAFLYFEGPANCRTSSLSNYSEHYFSGYFAGYT